MLQTAEKSYKFYNKHRLETEDRYYEIQFERLKMVAKRAKNTSKLTIKDICK